jgi:acetyl-CoA synthetase
MAGDAKTLDSLLRSGEVFTPSAAFREKARVRDEGLYRAASDPRHFWAQMAREVEWSHPWEEVLEWDPPFAKWFLGGKLNLAHNCLDRHASNHRRNKVAFFWQGEPGDQRAVTYYELLRETCRFANALRALGVHKGDRVTLYLGMVPELPVAMLACARLGAVHSVVFGGFSSRALADRIRDAQAKVLITADGAFRKGGVVPLKANADEALEDSPTVERVVVLRRTGQEVPMLEGRDIWWHEAVAGKGVRCEPVPVDSEDPLFILYTSGTTGKPKGVVHTSGGYLVGVHATAKYVFDLREEDVYWCTADIGWVTGHSYIVYGPLSNGVTSVLYEGALDHPKPDRFWSIVERHGVSVFYTAPTAIRAFMRWGEDWPRAHDLSTLRLLGTVGEPINPEAWLWYHRTIGGGRCPIVDTWWQTETGMIMIAPLPGVSTLKPGSATRPFPGIVADVVDSAGNSVPPNKGGYLIIREPWPAMLRTIYGDPDRYRQEYWSRLPGVYFTGDGARRDEDGYFWIMGRIDDVINVSGHRLGTMEIESALVSHPSVAEAAVVGKPHPLKGQGITAYLVLRQGSKPSDDLKEELRAHVRKEIGAIAVPDEIFLVEKLPKTRSGKIMRRVMRAVVSGQEIGDVTTLEDPSAVEEVRKWLKDVGGPSL